MEQAVFWRTIEEVETSGWFCQSMRIVQVADAVRFTRMSTEELRASFLIDDLFAPGEIKLAYIDLDHAIVGSVVPLAEPLTLEAQPNPHSRFFAEHREIGILNVGDVGVVLVDGVAHDLAFLDSLYIGKGSEHITFLSLSAQSPAEYYFISYPAHKSFPAVRVDVGHTRPVVTGSPRNADLQRNTNVIYRDGVQSCQLTMGFTEVAIGSAWNTFPPQVHKKRSEVRLYFELKPDDRVLHLMGPPHETRHILVGNKQAVITPSWSIHAGVGTSNYIFCWGMGGEHPAYDEPEAVPPDSLR
ncbi:MAG TPA: 5-dehydro-4-deoxy-D-glucuronate isomerase [Terracidiphilus sp.]|nr:5-dehydro-4-deoxy-D-glucuronate isomerase [Terracidiphilus sp.]